MVSLNLGAFGDVMFGVMIDPGKKYDRKSTNFSFLKNKKWTNQGGVLRGVQGHGLAHVLDQKKEDIDIAGTQISGLIPLVVPGQKVEIEKTKKEVIIVGADPEAEKESIEIVPKIITTTKNMKKNPKLQKKKTNLHILLSYPK